MDLKEFLLPFLVLSPANHSVALTIGNFGWFVELFSVLEQIFCLFSFSCTVSKEQNGDFNKKDLFKNRTGRAAANFVWFLNRTVLRVYFSFKITRLSHHVSI